jgi:prepilin-type N-terminal cleavage/methylation domain-containing protein
MFILPLDPRCLSVWTIYLAINEANMMKVNSLAKCEIKSKWSQRGVTFLEIIIVVAIIGVIASVVLPNSTGWKAGARVNTDYQSALSRIDYIKTRARILNGTGLLVCTGTNTLTYEISTNAQSSTSALDTNYTVNRVEYPGTNILSGNTNIASSLCAGKRGIFTASGLAGLEGGGAIDLEINYNGDRTNYPAYRILVNQSTAFVQKFKWKNGAWVELD